MNKFKIGDILLEHFEGGEVNHTHYHKILAIHKGRYYTHRYSPASGDFFSYAISECELATRSFTKVAKVPPRYEVPYTRVFCHCCKLPLDALIYHSEYENYLKTIKAFTKEFNWETGEYE